jgi:predicted nucleotidyltransferase
LAATEPVSRLESTLRQAARDLHDLRRQWALVGGLAVSARTEPRFTRDIDLVITVASDRDAEVLVHDLQGRHYRVQTILEQEATARLASARLIPVAGDDETGPVLDVLFASSGIEPEIVAAADTLEILPHLRVPVATIGHLIALKLLARDDRLRPQDRVDLGALLRAAEASDLGQARTAIALIRARGFHRDRDLWAELERLTREGL